MELEASALHLSRAIAASSLGFHLPVVRRRADALALRKWNSPRLEGPTENGPQVLWPLGGGNRK